MIKNVPDPISFVARANFSQLDISLETSNLNLFLYAFIITNFIIYSFVW